MTDSGQPLRRAPRFIRNLHSQSVRRHADVKLSCKISDVRVLNNLLKIRSLKMLVVLVGSSKKLDQLGRLFAILSFGNTKLLSAAQDVRGLNNFLKIRSLKMLVVLVGSSKKLDQLGRLFAILSCGNTKPLKAIQGNPEPEVLWYKNGKQFTEIKEIVQYEIKEDHQVHTLHFIRCTDEDAAVYQISARNSLGMISGSAIIEVGPITKAIIYQRLFRCPAKNTQTSSRNNSIKGIEGPAKGEPRLANAQEEHKGATSTPAALSSPFTAQTHDQKPGDSQNTSTVGSHREQKSLHSLNTPDTFMAKRPKNKNRKRQPINRVILDAGGDKEAHSKALAQRPNPEGHREKTRTGNAVDLRIFEESDLCEPVTRPASEGHTRCVTASEQEDAKAHFGSAKKASPADERLVNDSGQLGGWAVRGGQCQETGQLELQVGTARSAPERQPIDDVNLKEEVCVCVQETHHTNDVTLLNKTGPENHIGEVAGLSKDSCLATSENQHRTDDVRPKKGDSTIGPKIHFADDVSLNEAGCCTTVSESEPADDSRLSREGCLTVSKSYHARDVSLSQESCVSAPKNHHTDKVQLSKEGCFTAPQSECADDVRSRKEDFRTGPESHPLDDVSLSNVGGIPATKSYNTDDVTDFSRKFCMTAPECHHAHDARQKKRDYMIGPESHRDDDVRLRKEDSMMGLEKRHADDVSLNQQVRLNGYDHYPSDWPVWQGVSGDTVTRGPPIGLCDNQSDSAEAAARGARPEGTHPDPGTDMVLSAGHRQQQDLPPLKAHKRVKLAVATQNDSAAFEEGGSGGRKAAGGSAQPFPRGSDEARETSGDPLLAEEVTKLMTEKTTVEGLSEGSPTGTPARPPGKEDCSKTRKVNSAGGRCDPTLNKSSLENEVTITTLAGGTGNCREITMDPGSCVVQQQTATHRATPVTLHIEELDLANHCEGRSGLPDTASACSANALQEIPMMCEMDFAGSTNVMCHLVTEDPTALIVPPLMESGNMSPSSKICNAPQSIDDMDVNTSQRHSENMQLSNHLPEIHNDVAITNGSELVSQVTKSTDKESPASLNITQTSRPEKEVYNCSQKEYENMETEMGVTPEELDPFPGYPCTEGGEEIEFNQLFFRDDFISDSYFSGNIHGKIATEELHFGEGVHRKAFRSKVIYGLVPVFRPGHVCVLKVHNAVAYGTKTTDELIQRNYKLASQECYVQNTAREYAKMYAAEAEHLEDFGRVPEIIPIFLIHRLANHIPYATVEEELVGDFVKYSIRDGKEINFMRRDSEAGQKCCTFQHWVFQKTSGNLLVTDMQGVGMKLTDVGIATLAKGYKGFKGNCSISFIEQFKVLHLCNKYCEMLGLKSLQKQKKPGAAKTKAPPTPSASSRKTVGGARPKGKR